MHRSSGRRVIIAGGGTAGDVMPAVAFAQVLASRGVHARFLGGRHGFEARLVPAAGIPFDALDSQPLFGAGLLQLSRLPHALLRGVLQARAHLRINDPAVVIGFGGHASLAPLLAARHLGIPTAIYEANARAGVANAALAPWVDRVFVADLQTRWPMRPRIVQRVGRVIRQHLEQAPVRLRQLPRGRPLRILVLSGSQGSSFLNERIPALLGALNKNLALEVWHQTGLAVDAEATMHRYRSEGVAARVDGYVVDLCSAYAWADFAISAAGAGTIAELCAMAVPALLIPLESVARDHQLPNAQAHAACTGSLVCAQRDFDVPRLTCELNEVLSDPERYAQLVCALLDVHAAGGGDRLADACLALGGIETRAADYELPRVRRSEVFSRSADNDVAKLSSHRRRPPRSASARSHKA